jgi:predicted MFS family arabinose efflux permease
MQSRHATLYLISLCGFTSAIANRSMDPLVSTIAGEFGLPLATAALVITIFALPYSVGQPILGPLGDHYGTGRVLRACLWVQTASLAVVVWSPSFEVLLAARFVGGIASGGLMPVALATISNLYPPQERQQAIARNVAALQTGFILAASLSGMLAVAVDWRGIFVIAAILSAISAALVTLFVPSTPPATSHIRLAGIVAGYRTIFANPRSWVCFAAVFLEGIALNGCLPFIAPILEGRGAGGPREAGFIITGLALGALVFTFLVRRLLAVTTRHRMMLIGGFLAFIAPLALAFDLPWPWLMLLFVVAGFGYMMVHNSIHAEVSELSPTARASAFAMHSCSLFVGTAIGPVWFALMSGTIGTAQTLYVSAIVMFLIGPVISALLTRLGPRTAR